MKVSVIWTLEAVQDREDIWNYIAEHNPRAAAKIDSLFSKTITYLIENPHLGQVGKVLGTREFIPHEGYRLIYEIKEKTVWILALVHTARQWPPAQRKK